MGQDSDTERGSSLQEEAAALCKVVEYWMGESKESREAAVSYLTKSESELMEAKMSDQDLIDLLLDTNANRLFLDRLDRECHTLLKEITILRRDLPSSSSNSSNEKGQMGQDECEANISSEEIVRKHKYHHLKDRYWWCRTTIDQVYEYEFFSTMVHERVKEVRTLRQEKCNLEAKIREMKPAEKPVATNAGVGGKKRYDERFFDVTEHPEARELLRKLLSIKTQLTVIVGKVDKVNESEIVEDLLEGVGWEWETPEVRVLAREYITTKALLSKKVAQL